MKKFTEEQYRAIAKAGDNAANEVFGLIDSRVDFEELLRMEAPDQDNVFYPDFNLQNQEIMAIANPATREEAKEKYVEKEKKYYWISKNHLPNGKFRVLVKSSESYPIEIFYPSTKPCTPFTESEVREACFNPDMFEREEVE
ncbi:hypothetical protein R53718_MFFEMHAI_01383 [Fructobacillus evanidus]|uniref:hypothetical protein n=1 Tax=Fructobacillus evanidus TaxID=3064281 RepID=UPI002DA04109|nr:hypothetical protein R53718_MFFEMHAI_01383 [Fructobacillus sp. LMG 32999]